MSDSSYMQGDRDNAVAVPFTDDEKEKPEDIEEDSPAASEEERITRKQKRQERLTRLLNEGKQSKEELASLKAEQATLKTELAQLRGYVAAQPQQRAANDDGKDPYQRRLDAIYERQSEAFNAAQAEIKAGTFTPERQQHYDRVAREIEESKTSVHTERILDSRAQSMRTEQAQQVWVQKYPEVYNNPRAFQYAQATYQRRQALGEQPNNAMVDEIMNEAMAQFRLGGKQPPTASEKSRMSGMPSAGGGGSSKSAGIVMDPKLRRMAIAAHPDLPEEQAVKKWVDTTGKRLREKKVI